MMGDDGVRFGLVLDCEDPERLAEFWAPALEYLNVGTADVYVALFPEARPGPKLLLQRVEETKAVKNRMHLDIETRDIELEANRLVGLGATRVSEHGSTWILMTDPEGNEFCVCDTDQSSTDGGSG